MDGGGDSEDDQRAPLGAIAIASSDKDDDDVHPRMRQRRQMLTTTLTAALACWRSRLVGQR
jgi:hypothetical protein